MKFHDLFPKHDDKKTNVRDKKFDRHTLPTTTIRATHAHDPTPSQSLVRTSSQRAKKMTPEHNNSRQQPQHPPGPGPHQNSEGSSSSFKPPFTLPPLQRVPPNVQPFHSGVRRRLCQQLDVDIAEELSVDGTDPTGVTVRDGELSTLRTKDVAALGWDST